MVKRHGSPALPTAIEEHGLLAAAIMVRASETLDVVMSPVGLPLCTIAFK